MTEPLLSKSTNPYEPTKYDVSAENDIRASFAADVNQLLEQKQSYHIKALFATLLFWMALPAFIVMFLFGVMKVESDQIVWICLGVYVLYLILAFCCNPLFKYLGNIQHGSHFQEEYEKVKRLEGHFVFNVQCYHYETRHHTRTVSDGNGGYRTEHYTTTQKVVTYRNTETLFPIATRDDSGKVDEVRALTMIIFVHYIVSYRFIDENSRQIFDREWHNFQSRNKFDVHQNYTYRYELPGLIERMTFFIGDKKPEWMKYLIVWTILGLIWPYSMWVQSKISRFNINFLKILTMGYKH